MDSPTILASILLKSQVKDLIYIYIYTRFDENSKSFICSTSYNSQILSTSFYGWKHFFSFLIRNLSLSYGYEIIVIF